MDIYKLYQYVTTFITIKHAAINTARLWRRPVLGQSEIVCTVAILDVQGDTAISLCRERSLARRRALAFRRGRSVAHILDRTSGTNRDLRCLTSRNIQAHYTCVAIKAGSHSKAVEVVYTPISVTVYSVVVSVQLHERSYDAYLHRTHRLFLSSL